LISITASFFFFSATLFDFFFHFVIGICSLIRPMADSRAAAAAVYINFSRLFYEIFIFFKMAVVTLGRPQF